MNGCRAAGCRAPRSADHRTLHATSDAALLTTYAALTHQIEAARRSGRSGDRAHLRAQRALAQNEILRRMAVANSLPAAALPRVIDRMESAR